MKIEINTGTSGDDMVVIVTEQETITLPVARADELAIAIAQVAAQSRRGNDYREEIEV